MYEEKKRSNKRIRWISVLIKLAILFLVVFAVWYLIIRINNKKGSPKKLGASMSDNINYLKKQYTKYFNKENAPKYTDAESKIYLKELVETKNSKVIYDKNGEKCSSTSSYGKLVKNKDGNYQLKIYLKCKNEADSELFTIKHSEIIDATNTSSTDDKKDNTKVIKDNDESKKNNTTNDKANNTEISNSSNATNQRSNTKTNNNTSKSNTSTTKQVQSNSNRTSNQNTSVTSTTTTKTTSQVAIVEKEINVKEITSDPNRVVLTEYLLYKLGDLSYTVPDKKHINYEVKIPYYKYCNNDDMQNCHTNFAKIPANEQAINDLLSFGYTEYLDYVDTVTVYFPIIEEVWSSSINKEGYIYSGQSRTHYRVN